MSSRRSQLRKILRARHREEKKQKEFSEKYRLPGETDEEMQERMTRDLGGWLEMMSEREIEEALVKKADELKTTEALQETQINDSEEEN